MKSALVSLPLLTKELLEQAARRRTYVIRTVYACLLFGFACLICAQVLSVAQTSPLAVLGHGREIFSSLVLLQFAGIYLFMPAITCGVLTQEKERDSLALLFLTRLGPWTILFEKLLGRLIPMFTFMLLCLPLLAIAYSLGGVTPLDLAGSVLILTITIVQVGTLALACSAYCRTTVAAFVATYLWGVVLSLGLPLCMAVAVPAFAEPGSLALWLFGDRVHSPKSGTGLPLTTLELASNALLFDFPYSFCGPVLHSHTGAMGGAWTLAIRCLPILFSSSLCLWIARLSLIRRAFAPPRNPVLNFFRGLDRFFWRLNQNRLTRGKVLIRDSTALPEDEPIAWRETSKKSFGTTRYLLRVFLALEFPAAAICLLFAGSPDAGGMGVSLVLGLLWLLAVLLVAVQGASLISRERTHQTWDVLLTTPLSSREILRQKYRGVRRLMVVLAVPFATLFLFQALLRVEASEAFLYLLCSLLSIGIYLPLAAWLSVWFGLRSRTQTRAIIGALGCIVAWCVLPYVAFIAAFSIFFQVESDSIFFFLLFSPAAMVLINEYQAFTWLDGSPWGIVLINFAIYGLCLISLRQYCLGNADRILGRSRCD